MIQIVFRVLSIFVIVGLGHFLFKKGYLPKESEKYLTNLMIYAAAPCMFFHTMAAVPFDETRIVPMVETVIASVVYIVFTMVFVVFVVKIFKMGPKEDAGIYMALMTSVNIGFMAFPITKAIFGDLALFYMLIFNVVLGFYMFFLVFFQMEYANIRNFKLKTAIKSMMNPPFIGSLLGLIFFLARIELPGVVLDTLSTIGNMVVPISMILVGVQLGSTEIKKIITNRNLIISTLFKLIIIPAIFFISFYLLPLSPEVKLIVPYGTVFPAAAILSAVSNMYHKNSALAAEGVAMSTFFSIFTISIWSIIYSTVYPGWA